MASPKKQPAKKSPVAKVGKKNASRTPHDPESGFSKQMAKRTEENLSPAMKKRRDHFISEYLVDFNAAQAFIRMKAEEEPFKEIDAAAAAAGGYSFTREPYVAKKIQEALEAMEEANIVTRKRVLGGLLREANYHGVGAQHGARVSSWTKLAGILKMDVKQVEASVALRGGVMIVPATEDGAGWEARAAEAQAALKEEVRK